jgi:integrase
MMVRQIKAHRPKGIRTNWNDDLNESSPPTAVVERFMAIVAFDSPDNPFKNVDVKLRNSLMFGLLFYTGMRRGELLSLRIDQFELGEHPLVWVRRNQDDLHDSRRHQPVSKTKERPLPLPRHLADQIHSYILNVRSKLAMARRHPYLFVSHRADKTQGQPLSISAFGSQIMTKARLAVPEFSQIHPHSFRHHFNYRMSIAIDKLNIDAVNGTSGIARPSISDAQELDARAFLNGHRSRKSGAIYNKRHTKEVADKVGKSIQNEILGTSLSKVRIDQQP